MKGRRRASGKATVIIITTIITSSRSTVRNIRINGKSRSSSSSSCPGEWRNLIQPLVRNRSRGAMRFSCRNKRHLHPYRKRCSRYVKQYITKYHYYNRVTYRRRRRITSMPEECGIPVKGTNSKIDWRGALLYTPTQCHVICTLLGGRS